MLKWVLNNNEVSQLKRILEREDERLEQKEKGTKNEKVKTQTQGQRLEIKHLLSSLRKATVAENFDLTAYVDTNYEFAARLMSVSYRIGDEPGVNHSTVPNVEPPPDEYLGIQVVLRELLRRDTRGSVLVITDASRCALALQMGLRYVVPKHSANQSPRAVHFGFTYDETVKLVKELEANGCHVEFSYRHRGHINEALRIA